MDSLIPVIKACGCFAMTIWKSLWIYENLCKPFFENNLFEIVLLFVVDKVITFGRHSWLIAVIKWESIQRNFVLFFTVVIPGLKFISLDCDKISPKNKSYLRNLQDIYWKKYCYKAYTYVFWLLCFFWLIKELEKLSTKSDIEYKM